MFMLLQKWTSPKSLKFSLLPTDLVTLDHPVFYTNYFNFCRSGGLSVIFVDQKAVGGMAVGKKAVTAAILSARLLFCLVIWLSNLITVDIIQNVLSDIAARNIFRPVVTITSLPVVTSHGGLTPFRFGRGIASSASPFFGCGGTPHGRGIFVELR
jgi:hypothetical protein